MSFRLQIFVLVTLVAATAIGATAWLTLNLTSREVTDALEAQARHRAEIVQEIQRYGLRHGNWPGVNRLVVDLSRRTGLHIRVQTSEGEVLSDSDAEAKRPIGPVQAIKYDIDPFPALRLARGPHPKDRSDAELAKLVPVPKNLYGPDPTDLVAGSPAALALRQAAQYRAGLILVRCLHESTGEEPALGRDEAPFVTPQQLKRSPDCLRRATAKVLGDRHWLLGYWNYLISCGDSRGLTEPARTKKGLTCLNGAYIDTVITSSAVPLELYLGGRGSLTAADFGRPAVVGAAGLLLITLAGTFLIARQVSRPVRRLTGASILLAAGHLDARVRTDGRSELAQLSQSFNTMARAVQDSEERQRRLIADVAHEMRTPLSNLRGYLEGLSDGVIEPDRELFASLHEETMLQGRILDDLQVLALAEAGELGYSRTPTDLTDLASSSVTAHRAVAIEAGIELTADAPQPVWIEADPDRMRQVLGNLLTNAIRYTDRDGRVIVRVRAEGGRAVLEVRDTGVGISAGDLPHVFERFWRADPARQRATGGTGLGLTIAHRIVTDHGGRIEVVSQPHLGTNFTLSFPLTTV
ncbi:sensor histidine kinase [Actinoplanes solisilvae]|uniref:sensor histidine kinase n=1 Tax=Actinoplanes solisilvae TaxID=2486853 RepID=UPI000FDA8779|nr:ATP-binding protein [Actinoplanes solisilvae]